MKAMPEPNKHEANEKEQPLRLDLLRHGITTAGKCFLGSTDAQLTEEGLKQMKLASLSHDYACVISSPLLRCREFAELYAEAYAIPFEVIEAFREIDFGDWEGKTSEELWQQQQQAISAFWQDPFMNTPPGAEPMQAFIARIKLKLDDIYNKFKGQPVLYVGHAGVCKVIICEALKLPMNDLHRLTIDHGGVSRVNVWQDYAQLEFLNR